MKTPESKSGVVYDPYVDDEEEKLNLPVENDPVDENGNAIFEKPMTDNLINLELLLPHGEEMQPARVVKRHKGEDGTIKGTYSDNPIANTILYDVEFNDGSVREYSANVIAENLYDQVDADGYSHSMLDCIVDVRKTIDAVLKEKMYITTSSGKRRLRHTTAGWEFLVRWKDGQEQWVPLIILKESNPVDVAEFVKAKGLQSEPAFR